MTNIYNVIGSGGRKTEKNEIEKNSYGKVQASCYNIYHESKTDFNNYSFNRIKNILPHLKNKVLVIIFVCNSTFYFSFIS